MVSPVLHGRNPSNIPLVHMCRDWSIGLTEINEEVNRPWNPGLTKISHCQCPPPYENMCVPCEDNMPAACAAQAPFDYKMTYPSHFIDHPQENNFQIFSKFSAVRVFVIRVLRARQWSESVRHGRTWSDMIGHRRTFLKIVKAKTSNESISK